MRQLKQVQRSVANLLQSIQSHLLSPPRPPVPVSKRAIQSCRENWVLMQIFKGSCLSLCPPFSICLHIIQNFHLQEMELAMRHGRRDAAKSYFNWLCGLSPITEGGLLNWRFITFTYRNPCVSVIPRAMLNINIQKRKKNGRMLLSNKYLICKTNPFGAPPSHR